MIFLFSFSPTAPVNLFGVNSKRSSSHAKPVFSRFRYFRFCSQKPFLSIVLYFRLIIPYNNRKNSVKCTHLCGAFDSCRSERIPHPYLSDRFRDPRHAHIDIRYFIPGGIIRHTCLWQIKNVLESSDRFHRFGAIDTIYIDLGNRRIVLSDPVQLPLQLSYLSPEEPIVRSYPGQEYGTPAIVSDVLIYISSP